MIMKTSIIKILSLWLFMAVVFSFNSCSEADDVQAEALIVEPIDSPYDINNDDGSVTLRTDCDGDDIHWAYDEVDHWDDLCDHWACGGIAQSPINIIPPMFSSPSKYLTFDWNTTGTHIVNNGHTIQFNYDSGSKLSMLGGDFRLLQFHFHADSEHTVNGNHAPAEIHFVHQNMVTGKLAVIGVFVDTEGAKDASGFFDRFLEHMPEHEGEYDDDADIFSADMLMPDTYNSWKKQRFWYYSGSLTTPPCSEIVTWIVMKDRVRATQEQLDEMKALMTHDGHENYRPTQPMFSRIVSSHGPIMPFDW